MHKIFLKWKEEKRLEAGHLWIFSNEIQKAEGAPVAGDIVELVDHTGKYLATGFYNPNSLIAFRFLSKTKEEINKDFWIAKIQRSAQSRKDIYPCIESYRAVFGESDGLPGLIVDKYAGYLAVQFLSAGIEKNREDIIEALKVVFSPEGIIARNDSGLRALEGLEEKTEVLFGDIPEEIEITENGIKFLVNLSGGQKTGFFFDQRDNRQLIAAYCKDKNVLDCYCHTGAFGVYAAKAGAKSVVMVDSSKPALEKAFKNAQLNGVSANTLTVNADAEEYLISQKRANKKFDIIMIDPPALIKNKKSFFVGVRLYSKLNALAMELLEPGGLLASTSCSHHLPREPFVSMLRDAAGKTGKQFIMLELRPQSKDHPVLLSMPETEYLKFAILKLV